MHTDTRNLDNGTQIRGDICIIGAGAAGISMALEWIHSPYQVVLLEGGGYHREARMQALYKGDSVGQPYYTLEAARLRYFGGTTGHWNGFCATLDPIDFERRNWVPHSGWPIDAEDIDRFCARGQSLLELGPYNYSASYWEARNPDFARLPLDQEVVWTKMWQLSPPTLFGTVYRDQIIKAPNVHLYTYASVTELVANQSVRSVTGLRVKTLEGKELRVRAQYYVLACGAIQNARLLLASNRQAPAGLGNDQDLVGRHFMEHIEMPGAQLVLAQAQTAKMYMVASRQTRVWGELALSRKEQRAHKVLNGTASLQPGRLSKELKSTFQKYAPSALERLEKIRRIREASRSHRSRPRPEPTPIPQREYQLITRQEQAPNPDSRISLSEKKDELGMPRVKLDWRLSELDKRSIRAFYEVLGREFGRAGLGRVQVADWLLEDDDRAWPSFLSGGWHHLGTLRMHSSPRRGVVDADCKVHGIDNLYVAGTAVFPTAGAANPTLTLIALSLRLSDHLKANLRRRNP